jgi:hypothetical protein
VLVDDGVLPLPALRAGDGASQMSCEKSNGEAGAACAAGAARCSVISLCAAATGRGSMACPCCSPHVSKRHASRRRDAKSLILQGAPRQGRGGRRGRGQTMPGVPWQTLPRRGALVPPRPGSNCPPGQVSPGRTCRRRPRSSACRAIFAWIRARLNRAGGRHGDCF